MCSQVTNTHEIFQNKYLVDLLKILRSDVGSSSCTPYTCLIFQMASGNILCYHNSHHLMRDFEFLQTRDRSAFLLIFQKNYIEVPAPNESLMFKKFGTNYVNHHIVVLTNYCQSSLLFLFDVHCSKLPRSFFCCFLCKLFLRNTPVAPVLFTPRWVSRQKDLK